MPKDKANYRQLNDELEVIMADLQHEDIDVDTALARYQRGLEVIAQLEKQLQAAESKVKELKSRFKN